MNNSFLGKKMWSAFECSTLAELAQDVPAAERHFSIGVAAGRKFISELKSGKITNKAMRASTPIGITMRLGGPSADFIIGRIYESVTSDTHKSITRASDIQVNPYPAALK